MTATQENMSKFVPYGTKEDFGRVGLVVTHKPNGMVEEVKWVKTETNPPVRQAPVRNGVPTLGV